MGRKERTMEEKMHSQAPRVLHPHLSADEVHKNILRLKAMKARIDFKLFVWIGILIERKCHTPLGYATPKAYLKHFLKYGKSETNEIIRVAKVLPSLPKTARAFEKGDISWTQLKAIARVAKPHREERWLEFAMGHSADAITAEARDAERNGRDHPRAGSYGLPNIYVDERFLMTREEQEILRKALEKKGWAKRIASGDEERRPTAVEGLGARAEDERARDEAAARAAEKETRERPASFQVVYVVCTKCQASGVLTEDGLVEVPHEHVVAIGGRVEKMGRPGGAREGRGGDARGGGWRGAGGGDREGPGPRRPRLRALRAAARAAHPPPHLPLSGRDARDLESGACV